MNGKIIGQNSQTIVSNLKGDFDLKKLVEFLNIESVESVRGTISLNNQFRGTKQANNTLRVTEFTGTAKLINASMKLKHAENSFDNFVGDPRDTYLKKYTGLKQIVKEIHLLLYKKTSTLIVFLL